MSMEYPCVYFEKNGRCRKFSDDTAVSYCVMGPCPEQTLSNADRLRAMSDEDLAEFLSDFKDCAGDCLVGRGVKDCSGICATRETLKMWLKQLSEEDT